jgi:hypothetical protein
VKNAGIGALDVMPGRGSDSQTCLEMFTAHDVLHPVVSYLLQNARDTLTTAERLKMHAKRDEVGDTLLMTAIRSGAVKVAVDIVHDAASVDVKLLELGSDGSRSSALLLALMFGFPSVVTACLDAGAKMTARTATGGTVLDKLIDCLRPDQRRMPQSDQMGTARALLLSSRADELDFNAKTMKGVSFITHALDRYQTNQAFRLLSCTVVADKEHNTGTPGSAESADPNNDLGLRPRSHHYHGFGRHVPCSDPSPPRNDVCDCCHKKLLVITKSQCSRCKQAW